MPYRLHADLYNPLALARRQGNGEDGADDGTGTPTDTEVPAGSSSTRATSTAASTSSRPASSSAVSTSRSTSRPASTSSRATSSVASSTPTSARSTSSSSQATSSAPSSTPTSEATSSASTPASGVLFSTDTDTTTLTVGAPTSYVQVVASTNSDGTVYTVTNVVSSNGTGLSKPDSGGNSFMSNKPAVIGVFLTVAFAVTALILVGAIWMRRRMKESKDRTDNDFAITAVGSMKRPPTPDHNDQPEGDNEKSTSSHGTLNQQPMAAASAIGNNSYGAAPAPAATGYGATTDNYSADPYSNAGRNDYAYGNNNGYGATGYNDGYNNQAGYNNGYGNQAGYYDNYGNSNGAGGYYNDGYGQNNYSQDPYGGTAGGYGQDQYGASGGSNRRADGYDDYGGYGQSGYADRGGYDDRGYNDYPPNNGGYNNDYNNSQSRNREGGYGDAVDDYYGQSRTGPLRVANE